MRATVYKSTGIWYVVRTDEGEFRNARIKGVLRIDGITSTNPVAVGDRVELAPDNEEDDRDMIVEILPRENYINRQAPGNRFQHHIIAANVDQSVLVATLRDPRTSTGFMDRFLVTCEAYHVPAVILFNKTDLYGKKEWEIQHAREAIYAPLGYRVIGLSLTGGEGFDEVASLFEGKVTLLSGHSGVGKSSLINRIQPGRDLRTGDVSGWSGKGTHTTTFAEMFDLEPPLQGRVIDTPGIREFGLVDMPRQELSHYFPEMRAVLNDCRYNDCRHVNEPGCAVKAAVESGEIHEDRYVSYVTILDSLPD